MVVVHVADDRVPATEEEHVLVIKQDQLPWSQIARELVGADHGLDITLLFVEADPGRGPSLHRHPYPEVFITLEGEATFNVEGERLDVRAGDIVVAHAGEAHGFVNSGQNVLKQVDIHLSPTFSTEWLAAED
jgi:quercetin dioxygenase-like cupin family protein